MRENGPCSCARGAGRRRLRRPPVVSGWAASGPARRDDLVSTPSSIRAEVCEVGFGWVQCARRMRTARFTVSEQKKGAPQRVRHPRLADDRTGILASRRNRTATPLVGRTSGSPARTGSVARNQPGRGCSDRNHRRVQKEKRASETGDPSKWSGGDSNSRPHHCERCALPAELPPRVAGSIRTTRPADNTPARV